MDINMDKYIFEFVGHNWFTLSLVFGILKILANESKSTLDNKIFTFLGGALKSFKKEEK